MDISIHALRKECDGLTIMTYDKMFKFLSTHSVRSATEIALRRGVIGCNFYPRTP